MTGNTLRDKVMSAIASREPKKVSADETRFRCPFPTLHTNGDRNPSARFNSAKEVWICDACGNKGGLSSLAEALGIKPDPLPNSAVPDATYTYGEDFRVVRLHGKRFRQQSRVPGGEWQWGLGDVKPYLYRRDKLKALKPGSHVLVCEGEKDVHTAELMELAATTSPMGAGKWRDSYSEDLRGHHVCVIADNDEPGRKHAQQVARSLHGIAASVRVIEALPGVPEKGDLSDWHAKGGTRDGLRQLIKETPEYVPPAVLDFRPGLDWTQSSTSSFPVPMEQGNNNSSLRFVSLPELLTEPEEQVEWQWEDLLITGGTSLVVAKPKTGKSTLGRALALQTAIGGKLLDRACRQGPVLFIGVEEKRSRLAAIYRQMPFAPENLFLHIGPPPDDPYKALYTAVAEIKPVLVWIDPILKYISVRDSNDYAVMSAALAPIEAIARQSGAHIAMSHHMSKLDREDGDQVLGSTAIFAAVDTVLTIRRQDTQRRLSSRQRFGTDLEAIVIELDQTGMPKDCGSVEGYEVRKASEAILTWLDSNSGAQEKEIRDAVSGKTTYTSAALRLLIEEHKVTRTGEGKKGNPFRYEIPSGFSFPVPPKGREQGTRKPEPLSSDAVDRVITTDTAAPTSKNGAIPNPDVAAFIAAQQTGSTEDDW